MIGLLEASKRGAATVHVDVNTGMWVRAPCWCVVNEPRDGTFACLKSHRLMHSENLGSIQVKSSLSIHTRISPVVD